jgi:hypothetical protein
MKQILQSLKTGATEVADVPCPAVGRGKLLIGTTRTLVNMVTRAGMRVGLTTKPIAGVKVARAPAPKRLAAHRKSSPVQLVSYFAERDR